MLMVQYAADFLKMENGFMLLLTIIYQLHQIILRDYHLQDVLIQMKFGHLYVKKHMLNFMVVMLL